MLKTAKRLHALGFAIHWLQPKSKAPVESKWTSGDRHDLTNLKKSFRADYNIGVRLGKASKVSDAYLAVVDCDVKSTQEHHAKEMCKKLKELFGEALLVAPQVASGRGNGSAHYYIRTATPTKPKRLAQSTEQVEVLMPSTRASVKDIEKLGMEKVAKGIRLRAAWEISLMGEGQQVVLPPSIHPDSGKHYIWSRPITEAGIPLVEIKASESEKKKEAIDYIDATNLPDVSLMLTELPSKWIRMIEDGEGVEDRSAALFSAAMILCRFRFTDEEILSVLSDKNNFLGSVAYEHTKQGGRARAVEWLQKYTLSKARFETDAKRDFEEELVVEECPLSESETKAQHAELVAVEDWKDLIERNRTDGKPKTTLKNTVLILLNEIGPGVFKRDEFRGSNLHGVDTPWKAKAGEELRDIHLKLMKKWFADHWRFEPHINLVQEAAEVIAKDNGFHPVRDWLFSLPEWDKKPRVDTWLKRLLNAQAPEPYLSAISRKTLVAMVARVMVPGIKYDYVLILKGGQGVRKSTTIRELASPWGSDAQMNLHDKDGVIAMSGVWAMELGELSSLGRAETNQAKEFISRSTDRLRLPYGRVAEDFPRQCIFIGTTNKDEFLRDETGNRRFWPVEVGQCDVEGLKEEREQLFAEALYIYQFSKEELWLDDKAAEAGAQKVQRQFMESDSWEETIMDFFADAAKKFPKENFTMNQIFSDFGPLAEQRQDRQSELRAAKALRAIGFTRRASRKNGGGWNKIWYPINP